MGGQPPAAGKQAAALAQFGKAQHGVHERPLGRELKAVHPGPRERLAQLRLAPPGYERFLQSPQFVATFGGGEANVAVSVGGFGVPARYVTVLPPNNPISPIKSAGPRQQS